MVKSRTLRLSMGIIVAIGIAEPSLAQNVFSDVRSTHPNAEAISYVKAQGIVNGYSDGTYQPDQQINRAEFAKILEESIPDAPNGVGICPPDPTDYRSFSDVHGDNWFWLYVCMQEGRGIVDGYPDGTFRPASNINFVEAAKMLFGANHLDDRGILLSSSVAGQPWFRPYVTFLGDRRAIPTSIIRFDQLITRGEMAEMIYRLNANITTKPSLTYEQIETGVSNTSATVTISDSKNVLLASIPAIFAPYSPDANNLGLPHFQNVVFSPDGSRVAYIRVNATTGEGKWYFVEGNSVSRSYAGATPHGALGYPVFSDDGKHLAYAVSENRDFFIVLDGQEQKRYPVQNGTFFELKKPRFTPDTQELVYFAPPSVAKGDEPYATTMLVVGQKEISLPYPAIAAVQEEQNVIALGNNRFAYIAHTTIPQDEYVEILCTNGFANGDECSQMRTFFTAYKAACSKSAEECYIEAATWCNDHDDCKSFIPKYFNSFPPEMPTAEFVVVIDGNGKLIRKGKTYPSIANFSVSPDTKRLVYSLRFGYSGGKTKIEEQDGSVRDLSSTGMAFYPVFSRDGKDIAYIAITENAAGKRESYVVVNGKEGKHYEEISSLLTFVGSQRGLYSVRDNGRVFVVNGEVEGKSYASTDKDHVLIDRPIASPSGHVAYTVCHWVNGSQQGCFAVVDSTEGETYDRAWPPVFSSNGTSVGYGVLSEQELRWVTVPLQ